MLITPSIHSGTHTHTHKITRTHARTQACMHSCNTPLQHTLPICSHRCNHTHTNIHVHARTHADHSQTLSKHCLPKTTTYTVHKKKCVLICKPNNIIFKTCYYYKKIFTNILKTKLSCTFYIFGAIIIRQALYMIMIKF